MKASNAACGRLHATPTSRAAMLEPPQCITHRRRRVYVDAFVQEKGFCTVDVAALCRRVQGGPALRALRRGQSVPERFQHSTLVRPSASASRAHFRGSLKLLNGGRRRNSRGVARQDSLDSLGGSHRPPLHEFLYRRLFQSDGLGGLLGARVRRRSATPKILEECKAGTDGTDGKGGDSKQNSNSFYIHPPHGPYL